MNKENLKRLLDLTETIDPEKFSMSFFRESINDYSKPECDSVGCLIGYATKLDVDNILTNHTNVCIIENEEKNLIQFGNWSREFFNTDFKDWRYLFAYDWSISPETNTLKQAQIRIQKVLNGFNPETDWNGKYEVQKF